MCPKRWRPSFPHERERCQLCEALVAKEENVLAGARGGVVQHDVPISRDVLDRVQQGAIASPHTETKVKNAVKAALDN